MVQKEDLVKEYELLKSDPTMSRWITELERILLGMRASDLARDGVEQYVKITLAESSDRAKARSAFKEALSLTTQMWQTTDRQWGQNVAYLLDLIAAYTPPEGETKLLKYFGALKRFDFLDLPNEVKDELRLKVLVTMERYCDLARLLHEKEEVYANYQQVIEDCAHNDVSDVIRKYAEQRLREMTRVEANIMAYDTDIYAEEAVEKVHTMAASIETW